MQRDGAITARCAKAGINWCSFVTEVLDELEAQHIVVKTHSALHVFHVKHGMVEGELIASLWSRDGLGRLGLGCDGLLRNRSLGRLCFPDNRRLRRPSFCGRFSCRLLAICFFHMPSFTRTPIVWSEYQQLSSCCKTSPDIKVLIKRCRVDGGCPKVAPRHLSARRDFNPTNFLAGCSLSVIYCIPFRNCCDRRRGVRDDRTKRAATCQCFHVSSCSVPVVLAL